MVRSLAVGFVVVTMLAAAGSMTPAGRVILGVKHAAAAPTSAAVVQAKPAAKRVAHATPSPQARARARRAAVARRPQVAPALSAQALDLNQLLPVLLQSQSLPARLTQTTGAASPFAGLVSGGSSLTDLLGQLTDSDSAPESSPAPQPGQAPTSVAPAQSPSAPVSGEQSLPENKH